MPGSGSSASSSHTQLSCKELSVLTSKLLADVTWFLQRMWKACSCTEAQLQWVILMFKKIGINLLALTLQHHFSFYLSATYQQATLSESKMLAKERKSKFRKWWLSQRYRLRCVPAVAFRRSKISAKDHGQGGQSWLSYLLLSPMHPRADTSWIFVEYNSCLPKITRQPSFV